jgi:hypothetical protein
MATARDRFAGMGQAERELLEVKDAPAPLERGAAARGLQPRQVPKILV